MTVSGSFCRTTYKVYKTANYQEIFVKKYLYIYQLKFIILITFFHCIKHKFIFNYIYENMMEWIFIKKKKKDNCSIE